MEWMFDREVRLSAKILSGRKDLQASMLASTIAEFSCAKRWNLRCSASGK